jgi:hypothetical protein
MDFRPSTIRHLHAECKSEQEGFNSFVSEFVVVLKAPIAGLARLDCQ